MREWSYALYWLVTGALMGFGFVGMFSIGLPFLVVGMLMGVFGFLKLGGRGSWAFLVGLGGLPALVLLINIAEGIRSALNPYCGVSDPSGGEAGKTEVPPNAGPVECSFIPASYYVLFAVFAAIALSGVAARLLRGRVGRMPGVRWGAVTVGAVVAILATLTIEAVLDLSYQLLSEPFGAAFDRRDGRPTEIGIIIGTITVSIATFLAFFGGGYVAGRMIGSLGGLVGVSVAVLGVLLEGVMAIGPLLDVQEGDVLRGFFFVFLTVLGGCLGGWLGVRSGPRTVQPAG